MRGRGDSEPLILPCLSDVDKGILPITGMKMRELIKKNHEAYDNYQNRKAGRKVSYDENKEVT
jgi:hypothetical protein